MACGRPGDDEPIIRGGPWTDDGYYQWRSKVWKPTLKTAKVPYQVPYDLWRSSASRSSRDRNTTMSAVIKSAVTQATAQGGIPDERRCASFGPITANAGTATKTAWRSSTRPRAKGSAATRSPID